MRERESETSGMRPSVGSSIIFTIWGRIWRDNRRRRGQTGPPAEDEVRSLAFEINGVRERSNGAMDDCKASVNRAKAAKGRKRERADAEGLHNSLGEEEGLSYGIIAKLQGLRRAKNNFDRRMEDLGVWGDERLRLVTPDIDGIGRQGEAGYLSRETVPIYR